jgi:hypothetical protein
MSVKRNGTAPLDRLTILSPPQRFGDGLPLHTQSLTGRCESARQGGLVDWPRLLADSIAQRSRRPCESEDSSGLPLHGRQARQRLQRSGDLVLLARQHEAFCEAGSCRRLVAALEAGVSQTEQRPG